MATLDPLPYWTMSRLDLPHLARFEWLYKQPPPKKPPRSASHRPPPPSAPISPLFVHVGFRPSEYRSVPRRAPLRGLTAPDEHGHRGAFNDLHTSTQITKKFFGDAIFSVPLQKYSVAAGPMAPETRTRSVPADRGNTAPIHEVLFEESVDSREDIDPWGFSRSEKVVVHGADFHGIPLAASRLRPLKK
jgi:hypothetical protein